MAEQAAVRPMRFPVNFGHGGLAFLASMIGAASGEASGSGSGLIIGAAISAFAAVAVAVIGPVVTEKLRERRQRNVIDHRDELITEQADLIDHLTAELATYRDRRPRRDR